MLTPRLMLILARSILIIGSLSLVPASIRLFSRSLALGLPAWALWLIIPLAIAAGVGKARFVMRKRMRQNIQRLCQAQGRLWPWQIYPPQLLAFIFSMIVTMYISKRLLADSSWGLGILGGVDVGVAAALIIASLEYRRSCADLDGFL